MIPAGFFQIEKTPLNGGKTLIVFFPRKAPLQIDVFQHLPTAPAVDEFSARKSPASRRQHSAY
ncbi:MAG TPA: hypothetical protein VMB85_18635, partial [Bryobacteraceae bacterium]|nr:hypothetical protein [Bryobacteraceae bacterium]